MREGKKAYRDTHTSSKGNAWYAIRERNLAYIYGPKNIVCSTQARNKCNIMI